MASMYDELDEKLLNQLLVKITIIEKKGLQQNKSNQDIVKEIKELIEEKIKCVCRVYNLLTLYNSKMKKFSLLLIKTRM